MKANLNTAGLIFSLATTLIFATLAQAQSSENKRPDASAEQRPPHEPPPQAYIDCKDKKEGDAVQIVTPRDEKISAKCTASPKGLFARPDRRPEGNRDADNRPREKK